MAHPAHAGLQIEGARHGKHRTHRSIAADPGLDSQAEEKIDKGLACVGGRMRRADHGPEAEILPATHRGGHMAPTHVKRKHATLRKVSHREHLKPQAVKAFPSVVGLLPFVSQVAVGRPESSR